MKLALIRRQFSATGGAELYLERLLTALAQTGHEVHLFAEQWTESPPGVVFHPVRVAAGRAERLPRFAEAVQRELASHRFDCVFSLERTVGQDVCRAGDGVHRVWLERRRQFAPWWRKPFVGLGAFHRNLLALERRTFDPVNTRHLIVNSEMVRREILQHFNFPSARIHLVRNGVDEARFRGGNRAATRTRFGIQDDEFLLLFVGSGLERKGWRFLARFLTDWRHYVEGASQPREFKLPGRPGTFKCPPRKVKLLLVGKDRPGRLDNLIYAGPMNDVENAYAAADLLAFLPIYEPAANVVSEALAAGVPVVTSGFNGAAELLAEGVNGSVVANPAAPQTVFAAIAYWISGVVPKPVKCLSALDLASHAQAVLAILELAAREKHDRAHP